jgi:hypothetical protein
MLGMTPERNTSMKQLFRHSRLVLLTMVLAVVSLTVAATATPAVHAAPQPSITATGYQEAVDVQGSGFTPGGQVFVAIYDANYIRLNSETVIASRNTVVCSPITHICRLLLFGGTIDAFIATTGGYYGYVHVIAKDLSTSTWSNWSTTYARIIP